MSNIRKRSFSTSINASPRKTRTPHIQINLSQGHPLLLLSSQRSIIQRILWNSRSIRFLHLGGQVFLLLLHFSLTILETWILLFIWYSLYEFINVDEFFSIDFNDFWVCYRENFAREITILLLVLILYTSINIYSLRFERSWIFHVELKKYL